MNRETGSFLGADAHLAQSIADILGTRIGARLMRREYGSLLPELIDQPFNDATRLRVYAASTMALMRWEPRISLNRVEFQGISLQGTVVLDLKARRVDTNGTLNLSIPLLLGASA